MSFEICKRCNAKSVVFPGDPYCADCLPLYGTDAQIARYAAEVQRAETSARDAKLAKEEYRARTRGVSKAKQETEQQRITAIEQLRAWIKPGDTITTIVKHVSRSGMMRTVQPLVTVDGAVTDISWYVAKACNLPLDHARSGIKMGGCGMDMCFALVYEIGAALWHDGYGCIGEKCQSNDHSNGDRSYALHCIGLDKNGNRVSPFECDRGAACKGAHWHRDGGYALSNRQL